MPDTHSYPTVQAVGHVGDGGMGKRNQNNLNASFPGSPMYATGEYTTTEEMRLKTDTDNIVAASLVDGTATSVNDGGYMFSTFDLSFSEAPDLLTVETGGEGKPASPYYPNLTSPGEGSQNPADQIPWAGDPVRKNTIYGSGLGSVANPSDTSRALSEQASIGQFMSGKSFLGSDGKA